MMAGFLRLRLAEMFVREIEEDLPITGGHRVFARANVVTERTVDEASRFRLFFCVKAACTKKTIDRVSRLQHFELAIGIGPGVFDGVGQQHRTRRAQRNETMLVKREEAGLLVELLELRIEPVREARVNSLDRFADLAAAR